MDFFRRSALPLLLTLIFYWPAHAKPADPTDALAGLWKAKRWHGPFARGTLIVEKNGASFTAELAGRVLPVQMDKEKISFALPNAEGSFRGVFGPKNTLHGHWYPPRAPAGGFQHASPVHFERKRAG